MAHTWGSSSLALLELGVALLISNRRQARMPALNVQLGTLGPREIHYLASRLRFQQLGWNTELNQAKSSQAKQTKPSWTKPCPVGIFSYPGVIIPTVTSSRVPTWRKAGQGQTLSASENHHPTRCQGIASNFFSEFSSS